MKKGLISIALSTAVLAGGLMGSAPANAASVNYDAQIKSIESKIQVEKWKVYTSSSNNATASDKKAYSLFISSAKKKQEAYQMECSARGVEKFFTIVTKTKNSGKLSTAAQKHYNNIAAKSLKDAKYKFAASAKLFKESGIDLNKSYVAEKSGKSFKYKRVGMQQFFKRYSLSQSDCNNGMFSSLAGNQILFSSKSVSANNKYFLNSDHVAVRKELTSLRNQSKALRPGEEKSRKAITLRENAYNKSIKAKITSLEKELASVKAAKVKAKK